MLGSVVSVFGETEDCKKALEDFGCSRFLLTQSGIFRAHAVKLSLHQVSLLRMSESLSRIATYHCAPGMRRIILPPIDGELVCNGVEATPRTILTHGPDVTVIERISSSCEFQTFLIPESILLRSFDAIIGKRLSFPRGVWRWQPRANTLRRLAALHRASTGMSAATLDRAHGADSYRGLEQEIITAVVFCLKDSESQMKYYASNQRAEALLRAEDIFTAITDPARATDDICKYMGKSLSTVRRNCLEVFGLSPIEYHKILRANLVQR